MARNLLIFAGVVLFAALIIWALEGCGVHSYEQRLNDCMKDAGTYSHIVECQQGVECEYHTAACGLRLQ
jgi:hypothetical protein